MAVSDNLDEDLIAKTFFDNELLKKQICEAAQNTPQHAKLFEEIALYILRSRADMLANAVSMTNGQQVSKKRKLDEDTEQNAVATTTAHQASRAYERMYDAYDLSFQIPVRKKLCLRIDRDESKSEGKNSHFILRAEQQPPSDVIERELDAGKINQILQLPVPEKAQKQYNYCVIPKEGEPLLWTVNDGVKISHAMPGGAMQYGFDLDLEKALENAADLKITRPDEAEFFSATPEAHRRGEKAYHVKAFKGNKEGYLFFLANGIFFGFKKPLQFFPFEDIRSVSYTSVLQRTFNLTIAYTTSDAPDQEWEVEFSMIDQANFAGIDGYIKRHELQDASMAEARKAKRQNVNAKKNKETEEQANGGEPGELQKAAEQIQDEEDGEDELEEDYDPGSAGESEGEGSSSGEEDDQQMIDGENIVEEELGSEAEEVEPDPEDDDQL